MVSKTLNRIVIGGDTATTAERWDVGKRVRDVEVAPGWGDLDARGCQARRHVPRNAEISWYRASPSGMRDERLCPNGEPRIGEAPLQPCRSGALSRAGVPGGRVGKTRGAAATTWSNGVTKSCATYCRAIHTTPLIQAARTVLLYPFVRWLAYRHVPREQCDHAVQHIVGQPVEFGVDPGEPQAGTPWTASAPS